MSDIEVMLQESPVADHAANGEAENAVKQVKAQCRVLYIDLRAKLKKNLGKSHPLVQWLP